MNALHINSEFPTLHDPRAMLPRLFLIALAIVAVPQLQAESNGVSLTPPMGWSSWSFLRSAPTEANIEAQAAAMAASSLPSHGYLYINLDDFYYDDPATTVDAYGRWVPNAIDFPDGMAALARYIHSLGLKFGMYVTPGIPVAAYNQNTPILGTNYTAQQIVSSTTSYAANYNYSFGSDSGKCMYEINYSAPGAQQFINSWADLLASYGVDYVKLDGVGDSTEADIEAWSAALRQTGRAIHFELSNSLDPNNGAIWEQYANGWRISGDIEDYGGESGGSSYPLTDWSNLAARFTYEPEFTAWAGPGGWNELDSVEIGNGTTDDGLTTIQEQTMETLWAISCSPMFLGVDLTNLQSSDLPYITNDAVLAIDQRGVPAAPLTYETTTQVWRAWQSDGSCTVALFNTGASSTSVSVTWQQLGFSGTAAVTDVWANQSLGSMTGGYSVTLAPYACQLLNVVPALPVNVCFAIAAGNTLSGNAVAGRYPSDIAGWHAGYLGEGGAVALNNITVPATGTYNAVFMYHDSGGSRTADISVNGAAAFAEAFTSLSSWNDEGSMIVSIPLNAGTNSITLSNPSAYAPDIDAVVVQLNSPSPATTPIQAWRYKYFNTINNSGSAADTANPAGDGIPNLLKYAFGLNPTVATTTNISTDTETGYLRISVPLNPNATDITCAVQASSDLVNWTSSGLTVQQQNETLLRVQDRTPVSSGTGRFMRVQVTDSAGGSEVEALARAQKSLTTTSPSDRLKRGRARK